jgi:AcrR family transcriptional regulator
MPRPAAPAAETADRILGAAYAVFAEKGYAGATSLAIATRARVSKRSLYELFGNKAGLVTALIERRTAEATQPRSQPVPANRAAMEAALRTFGAVLLEVLTRPSTTTIYRLVMLESERAPELARRLDERGRRPMAEALRTWLHAAAAAGLIRAERIDPMTDAFFGVLQGEVVISLLLGLRAAPDAAEIAARAAAAAEAALALAR